MPSAISHVLFDLDDTLADTFLARRAALHAVFTEAGIVDPEAEAFLRTMAGAQMKQALFDLRLSTGCQFDLFERYVAVYWLAAPRGVRLYPGVGDMLRRLGERVAAMGIVTQKQRAFHLDGRPSGAQTELLELGIDAHFATVVGFEDVANHKPHPEPVLLALERLGADPRTTLVVGDSVADIESGRAAGCLTCFASWGTDSAIAKTPSVVRQAHHRRKRGTTPHSADPLPPFPLREGAGVRSDYVASAPKAVLDIVAGRA